MRFLSPLFFWSFLSLLPLVAVYLLKVRPRRAPTTAFFLWERVFHEKRATSLLRRLRDFWSLLLMCLVFCAICLALTRPQWISDDRKDLLIVVDNSASMNARDGSGTRLEKACHAARDIVRAMDGTQRAALATLSDQLVYRCHMTDSPQQLLDAITAVDATVGSFSDSAMQQAEGGEAWSDAHRVVLISDGGFDNDQLPDHVDWVAVGSQRDNVGLIAADMRYLSFTNRQLALYVQPASTFDRVLEVDLTISYANGEQPAQLVKLTPLEVQPGVNEPQILTIENAEPGRWTVQLDVDDPLEQDNLAYLAVEPPRPVRVAVETDDRFFFENSVSAFSRQAGLLTLDNQDPQVVIGKSTAPSATRVLVFQPEGESPWWTDIGEELDNVVPRVMMPQHPALRFTDPDAYSFVGAKQLSAPGNAQVWVASDQGVPLIYQTHRDGKTAIIVNMDPAAAEFYFSAWFPVFVHSAATYMAGRDTPLMASYRPSNVVSIPGVRNQDRTQLTDPTGANAEISGSATPPLNHLGFYTLANASGDWLVSCSLLSAKETLVGTQRIDNATATVQRGWSPAHWLTVLAIVILTVESLLYYRRKVG